MIMMTVTHLNHITTISTDHWERDLDRYLASIERDFGKTKPVAFTQAVSGQDLTDPTRFFELVHSMERIIERHGFRVDDGLPGYREPVSINF